MTRIAVITKSFAPDFELCVALNRSVLDNAPDTVRHHIIVPRPDLKLFGRLASARTHIRCDADLLPRAFVRVPLSNITVNLRRPFPPVPSMKNVSDSSLLAGSPSVVGTGSTFANAKPSSPRRFCSSSCVEVITLRENWSPGWTSR